VIPSPFSKKPLLQVDKHTKALFSRYFLKFLRSLALLNNPLLWEYMVSYLHKLAADPSLELFYIEFPSSFLNGKKEHVSSSKSIYKLVLQLSNYLLKCDINQSLEIFTTINLKHNHISLNDFEELTKSLQNVHFSENINLVVIEKPKTESEKMLFVLKGCIDYYPIGSDEPSLFRLARLNSSFKNQLMCKVAKRFLLSDKIEKNKRMVLWNVIAGSSSIGKCLNGFS
jgi:hypothetical protein